MSSDSCLAPPWMDWTSHIAILQELWIVGHIELQKPKAYPIQKA